MSSDSNFKKLKYGLGLVPNATTLVFAPGDIDYSTDTGRFNIFDGNGTGVLVTTSGSSTITGKIIPVGSNHITSTPNTAAQFNFTTGDLESSVTTTVELGYVSGVTSSIQTQLNGKQSSLTFADSIINTAGTVTLKGDVASPTANQYYGTNGSSTLGYYTLSGATGSVTSVGLAAPSIFTVTNSPVTTSGTLTLSYSGTPLPIANGGTNATSASAAYNNLSPMTTTGDMEYESAPGVASRLPIGATNQVLKVSGGMPTWATFTALTNPMISTGDIIYSSDGLGTPTRLGIGSTGQILEVVAGIPSWQSLPSPQFFASSQVTTASSPISSGTFTTFSNSPAFTFTPTITGTYKVYSGANTNTTSGATGGALRIINTSGSATLLYESQGFIDSASGYLYSEVFIQSVYTLTGGISYVFDIQGAAAGGTINLTGGNAPFYMFAEQITATGGGGGGIASINGNSTAAQVIAAGTGINVSSTGGTTTITNTGGGGSNPQIAYVSDQKAQGTNGGSSVISGFFARDLNTLTTANSPSWITTNGTNNFTLTAGTYDIEASSPYMGTEKVQTQLFNTTSSSVAILGTSEYSITPSTAEVQVRSFIQGSIVLAGTASFQVQYQAFAAQSGNGLGVAANFGTELYTQVKITKIA